MKRLVVTITIAVATLLSSRASATTSYTIGGSYTGNNLDYATYSWTVNDGGQAKKMTGLVGAIKLSSKDGSPNLIAVCTDVLSDLYLGKTYTFSDPKALDTSVVGTGSTLTWGTDGGVHARQALQNAAYIFYNNENLLTGGSAQDKAAVQLAVWAALYNTDGTGDTLTVNDSNDRFSMEAGSITDEVNQLLGDIPSAFDPYSGSLLQPLYPNGNVDPWAQEVLVFAPVPEPATYLAAFVLLLPFGVSVFRGLRKRNQH